MIISTNSTLPNNSMICCCLCDIGELAHTKACLLYKAPHNLPAPPRVSANTENSSPKLALPSLQKGSRVRERERSSKQQQALTLLASVDSIKLACCEVCNHLIFPSPLHHNGWPIPAAPLGICLWPPRQPHLLHDLPCPNSDVLPDLQEQVDGGVPVDAVRGGAVQRDALDLLRAAQDQRAPPHHHQRRRLRHRDRLHRHVPRLRAPEGQGVHGHDPPPPQRRRLRPHPPPHPPPLRGPEARCLPRLGLRRLLRQRLRRAAQHHQACDPDEERGVHALLPLPLAHPQRRRLVSLRRAHQGQIRRAPERDWLHLRGGPDGAVRVLHERDAGGRRGEGGEGGGEAAGGGARRRQRCQAWRRHRGRENLRGAPGNRGGQRRPQELRSRGGSGGGAGAGNVGGGHAACCRGCLDLDACMHALIFAQDASQQNEGDE